MLNSNMLSVREIFSISLVHCQNSSHCSRLWSKHLFFIIIIITKEKKAQVN